MIEIELTMKDICAFMIAEPVDISKSDYFHYQMTRMICSSVVLVKCLAATRSQAVVVNDRRKS